MVDSASKNKYDNVFFSLSPAGNPPKVSGGAARPVLLQSGNFFFFFFSLPIFHLFLYFFFLFFFFIFFLNFFFIFFFLGLPVEALRDIWGLVTSEGAVDQVFFSFSNNYIITIKIMIRTIPPPPQQK